MIKRRFIIISITVIFALVALGGAFWFGFDAGTKFPQVLLVREVKNIEPEIPNKADFSVFWQAWEVLNDLYLKNGQVEPQEKVYGAISGLVDSLDDPNSVFFKPKDSQKFEEDIKGNFGGIGAEIGIRKKQLTIIAPLKGTPALKAGLKPGDKILEVNSTSTEDLTVNESVQLIRGPVGTTVTLKILRDDWEKPRDFKIVRSTIIVPTLDFEMRDGGIAYIQLHSFNANSNNLFYQSVQEAMGKGSRGMILDLRNDPGGYLQVAIDLAGWFLPRESVVVSEVSKGDERRDFRTSGNGILKDFPVVVLVNAGSASASEILAGALRDHRKAPLIGEKTFGKGTVQQVEYLKDGSSIKVTTANWVLPSGKIIEGEGLEPDFKVEMKDEDIEDEKDPQLDKAIEVLKSLLAKT